jgi:pre-mRNA-processing factor 39
VKENGSAAGELDEAARRKAETRFYSYYQLFTDPDPNAQGPASFH